MADVGERLRLERERRSTSIEDLALASGIGQSYLDALERGEIDALPGPAFGKLYIRAYAEVLGFDPQPWIDDYDRERRRMASGTDPAPRVAAEPRPVRAAIARWKESLAAEAAPHVEALVAEAEPEPVPPEPEPAPQPPPRRDPDPEPERSPEREPVPEPPPPPMREPDPSPEDPPRRKQLIAAAAGLAALALVGWIGFGRRSPPPPVAPEPHAPPIDSPVAAPTPARPPAVKTAPIAQPRPRPPVPERKRERAVAHGALTVAESGTGRRIVASRLEGEATEFHEGEAVVFQTRVLGGTRGETIRHVWMYEGRAQQAISLRLGGADWRTHSKKTLYKRGAWSVEARDDGGRVLASAAFSCIARRGAR